MTIKTYEYYFGSALNRLIDESNKNLEIMSFPSDSNNCFTINKKIGLFIKYTERRNTPWGFQFKKKHQEELKSMNELHKNLFIVFVCYDDGFVCLEWNELKKILDEKHDDYEWVSIKRMRREKYEVIGKDGKLKYKIGKNDYPKKILLKIKE